MRVGYTFIPLKVPASTIYVLVTSSYSKPLWFETQPKSKRPLHEQPFGLIKRVLEAGCFQCRILNSRLALLIDLSGLQYIICGSCCNVHLFSQALLLREWAEWIVLAGRGTLMRKRTLILNILSKCVCFII